MIENTQDPGLAIMRHRQRMKAVLLLPLEHFDLLLYLVRQPLSDEIGDHHCVGVMPFR